MTMPVLSETLIFCTTRTGRKIHSARPNSSVTVCGHWLRVNAAAMAISETAAARRVQYNDGTFCERCFGKPALRLTCHNRI